MNSKRFRIAFSFAGVKRPFVKKVARILANRFDEAAILYDKFHEAEFANPNLAFDLPLLYKNADLIVAVFCSDYEKRDWCGLEWRVIFSIIKEGDPKQVMLARFDRVDGKGLHGLGGFIELNDKSPRQFASLILDRLAVNEGKPRGSYVITGNSRRGPKWLVDQNTLMLGELMIDITEKVKEPEIRRTSARHKFQIYQNAEKARHALGGVFFHARFLEPLCRSMHIVFPFPTMSTPVMDLEDEVSKLNTHKSKWNIFRPSVSRQAYSVRRTFLSATEEEVLRVDSGPPEQLNKQELLFIEEQVKKAMQSWAPLEGRHAVLLADYDLGLFSKRFIERIPHLLADAGASTPPIVVHCGRSWLKFAKLARAIIVSDWDEALVDYQRLDPESTSLAEEFDADPFPRIAKAFPDLHGFVLVRNNMIRAGFWRKDGLNITGDDIQIAVQLPHPQPRIGERAVVACWLCAALGSERSKLIQIQQAGTVLREAAAVLTDRLCEDPQTYERLERVMKSDVPEPNVRIRSFSERVTTHSTPVPIPLVATDSFPGRRLHVVCLLHEDDAPLYKDLLTAVEPQRRTGEIQVESEFMVSLQFQSENILNKFKSYDIVILLGTLPFYSSDFCEPLFEALRELQQLGTIQILPLELEERPPNIGPIVGINWINHRSVFNATGAQRWKTVIDAFEKPIATPAKSLPSSSLEQNTMAVYKNKRIALTENLAHYYTRTFPQLCHYFKDTHIPVLLEPDWLPRDPFPVSELDSRLNLDTSTLAGFSDVKSDFLEVLRANDRKKKLFNGLTYRLVKIEGMVFSFRLGCYYDFIKSCESLGYEAAKEWSRATDNSSSKWFNHLLPNRESTHPTDFAARSTAFGTCTLVVVKRRGKEPFFLLNQRSQALAETPGLKHVIPAGTFQPHGSNEQQVRKQCSFSLNIFRELIEELISDEGVRYQNQSEIGFSDSLTQKGKSFFHDTYEKGAYELFYLGTVMDPFNLKPEILTVGIFDEETSGLPDALHASWETDESVAKEAFTERRLDELMAAYDFVPTGKALLQLTKRHFGFLSSRMES